MKNLCANDTRGQPRNGSAQSGILAVRESGVDGGWAQGSGQKCGDRSRVSILGETTPGYLPRQPNVA